MSARKPHDALAEQALAALAGLARREARGQVPAGAADRGRERALAAFRASRRRPRAPAVAWLAAAAIAALIIVAGARALVREPPLAFTVDGAAATGTYVPAGATLRFSDGSVVAFAAGAGGRVAEVGPRGARILLEGGTASFHVVHRPGTRWSVEAGPFVIAVVGTTFDVRWSVEAQEIEVRLHEGAVTVNGMPLRAGQRLLGRAADGAMTIGPLDAPGNDGGRPPMPPGPAGPTASASPAEQVAPPSPAPPPPGNDAPAAPPPAREAAAQPSSAAVASSTSAAASGAPLGWPARVAAGDFRGVVEAAQARGVDTTLRSVPLADLVALADAARYAGDADLARRAMLAERSRFAASAEAHAAAFLLGRLADSGGGAPGAAVGWYDAYLAEAPHGAFAAEALGRKLAALRRAHDPAARTVAADYLQRYPKGPYAPTARELVSGSGAAEGPASQAP